MVNANWLLNSQGCAHTHPQHLTISHKLGRLRRCDSRQSAIHVAKRRHPPAQPLLRAIQTQRSALCRLHGRTSESCGTRRDHRTRRHHFPEPERTQATPQDAGRRLSRRRRLAPRWRVQTPTQASRRPFSSWTKYWRKRPTTSPFSKWKTTALIWAHNGGRLTKTTCHKSQKNFANTSPNFGQANQQMTPNSHSMSQNHTHNTQPINPSHTDSSSKN